MPPIGLPARGRARWETEGCEGEASSEGICSRALGSVGRLVMGFFTRIRDFWTLRSKILMSNCNKQQKYKVYDVMKNM